MDRNNNRRPGALILTRRVGESLRIGDDVVVTIQPHKHWPQQVSLKIEAPRDVRILRGELEPYDDDGSQGGHHEL